MLKSLPAFKNVNLKNRGTVLTRNSSNLTIVFILFLIGSANCQLFTINQYTELRRPDSLNKVKMLEEMDCNQHKKNCKGKKYFYDSLGRMIEMQEYDDDKYEGKNIYRYNNLSQLILMEEYDKKNFLQDRERFYYDSLNRKTEYIDYDSDGKIGRRVIYYYPSLDSMRTEQYDGKKVLEYITHYSNKDKHGNYLNMRLLDKYGKIEKSTFKNIEYYE